MTISSHTMIRQNEEFPLVGMKMVRRLHWEWNWWIRWWRIQWIHFQPSQWTHFLDIVDILRSVCFFVDGWEGGSLYTLNVIFLCYYLLFAVRRWKTCNVQCKTTCMSRMMKPGHKCQNRAIWIHSRHALTCIECNYLHHKHWNCCLCTKATRAAQFFVQIVAEEIWTLFHRMWFLEAVHWKKNRKKKNSLSASMGNCCQKPAPTEEKKKVENNEPINDYDPQRHFNEWRASEEQHLIGRYRNS